MRKILAIAFASLLLAAGAREAHAANEPLVLGLGVHPQSANEIMSQLIGTSLAMDPQGNAKLQPDECRKHGACATPLIYCQEFRKHHPNSGLPEDDAECLGQLARYVGGFVCRPVTGPAELDRLTSDGVVSPTGHARKPHKGEYACQDTATGEDMFWTDCGNVPIPAEDNSCYTMGFNAPVGSYVSWQVASPDGAFPASECNSQQQGSEPPVAWFGRCGGCQMAIELFEAILQKPAEILHRLIYTVTQRHQTFSFSRAVLTKVVYVCIETPSGEQIRAFYMRPKDWKGRHHAEVSDDPLPEQ